MILQKEEDQLLDIIDELIKLQIIKESAGSPDTFRFYNDKFGKVIFYDIDPEKRKQLHLEVGRTLRKIHGENLEPVLPALGYQYFMGNDHDLSILKYDLKRSMKYREQLEKLLVQIDIEQTELKASAVNLGQKIYAEKSEEFIDRIESYRSDCIQNRLIIPC